MISLRSDTFNENFLNEADQDANSLLTQLDKGLRSNKGDQVEAIVRFPKLFEKYPFPILINSSFLKLAEFFRTGSNLLRLWILRVCQQSEKHLEKILNVDEFVKRIFMVIHSNDPVARALTLRTLGAAAGIIPEEKQQVHHSIRKALDSHDTVEVEAAIFASVQFAAQSKTFAISMCSKVGSMIESLQTPVSMKLQLIPVLRHMYHDANTAALVKTLCVSLLPKYPSEQFIIVTLESLSQLSCATLVDIPDQVNLLITYLKDPRRKVRFQVLRSLQSLAEKGAHLWPKGSVKSLISAAMSCSDAGNEQSLVLSVVLTLTKCPVTSNSLLNEEKALVQELCNSCLVLNHHKASSLAIAILTNLVTYCYTEKIAPPLQYLDQINLHLESLIYACLMNENLALELAQYLKCGVQLAAKNVDFSINFVELVGGLLTDDCEVSQKYSILICETLAALCSQSAKDKFSSVENEVINLDESESMCIDESNDPFHELLPKLLKKLERTTENFDKKNAHFVEILSAVCLQALIGYEIPHSVLAIFDKVLLVANHWSQYRIARSASRYGHCFLAARIFQKVSKHVSLEKFYFFLSALTQISKAECVLMHGREFDDLLEEYLTAEETPRKELNLIKRLEKAISYYWKALASLKATSSPANSLIFQTEFVKLRGNFLEALLNVVIARNTQYITPPPAIAHILAQNSRDNLQKFGHVTTQFRKCVKSIRACEESYSKLYKSAFDADPCTLEHLEISQYLCGILSNSLEIVCFVSPSEPTSPPTKGNYLETAFMMNHCSKIFKQSESLPKESGNSKTITEKHTDVILTQIEMTLKSPLCLPRFFYQVLQSTSIKLALSPQNRTTSEPIIVNSGHNLVLKVEGVIIHSGKTPCLFRAIDSVQLTLVSQLMTQRPTEMKPFGETTTLTQTVKPHRDFLTGNFLLALNNVTYLNNVVISGGQWNVTLEACIIDSNGVTWSPEIKSSLMVRVPEEQTKGSAPAVFARRF